MTNELELLFPPRLRLADRLCSATLDIRVQKWMIFSWKSLGSIVIIWTQMGKSSYNCICRLDSGVRNRHKFFLWMVFLFQKIRTSSVNWFLKYKSNDGHHLYYFALTHAFWTHVIFIFDQFFIRIFWSIWKVCPMMHT